MLKITIVDEDGAKIMKLEGKIVGPWVEEFHSAWHSLAPSLGSKELQVDLRGVAFADDRGRSLLGKIYRESKARFLTNSPLTRFFAEDAMQVPAIEGQEGG